MPTTTMTRTKREPADAARVRLDPHPSRTTLLDGAWWPRSANAADELAPLMNALSGRRGQITHVLLNAAEWDLPHPARSAGGREAVRLCWYDSQPPGLVTIMSDFGSDRFDLLVVPADASQASADTAMTAAADATDTRHAPELLAGIEHRN
jgi:hypothetical protein